MHSMTEPIGHRSHLIDTGLYRPRHSACYLVEDGGEIAIIDTGTMHAQARVMAAIEALGATPAQVRYVIPTHVHLDHAGGAGQLMQACPHATLVVHPKGQAHMVDPSKLQAGAIAVYGEEAFRRDFGELLPIPAERTLAAADRQCFELGGRTLEFMHTPGHANHHGCIFDRASGYLYTGDTFGLGYTELYSAGRPLIVATTTPVAFDPDAWFDSLERMMALGPSACCLTHFGKVEQPLGLVDMLRESIHAHVAIALAEEQRDSAGREARLQAAVEQLLVDAGRAHCGLSAAAVREVFAADIVLNAQGLAVWLARRAKARA
jgi:glyoxylase-like metal-dependent hydrolase (beta-lactamase superfamily II)